jgi:hypothetical protein
VSEVQAISLMNVVSKLFTFGYINVVNVFVDSSPKEDSLKYSNGFYIWMGFAILSLIPAILVKEDLRRLNMKDVQKSLYVEEGDLRSKNP